MGGSQGSVLVGAGAKFIYNIGFYYLVSAFLIYEHIF